MSEQPARVYVGNMIDTLAGFEPESVDSIVCDPPYEINFMGRKWDGSGVSFDPSTWAACLRVLKPGGHLLAFGGTRTVHRIACAIEDAGFDIRDQIAWLYGTGFPKSLDVSKAIDRQRNDRDDVRVVCRWIRATMQATNATSRGIADVFGFHSRMVDHWAARDTDSQPCVPTLEQFPTLLDVLGVTLADVPDDVRRLILTLNGNKGQPGANWFKREVTGKHLRDMGGLDGQRLGGAFGDITAPATEAARRWQGWGTALKPACEPIVVARKPLIGTVAANVLAHGTGALNIDATRIDGAEGRSRWPANVILDPEAAAVLDEQSGSASRFFYVAKPSKRERGEGNNHPTVKPIKLMRYLVRLVTPPAGTVLDPFCGSGTTGVAAALEGFGFVGCELLSEHVEIAERRIAAALSAPRELVQAELFDKPGEAT